MAQVDLGERRNHHQPLPTLGADGVRGAAVCPRAAARRGAARRRPRAAAQTADGELVQVELVERPPFATLRRAAPNGASAASTPTSTARCSGAGASLFRDAEGDFTLLPARALEACHRAGVEVVIKSGRRRAQVMEDARLLGQSSYIFEVGAAMVIDGEDDVPHRRARAARRQDACTS